MKTELINLETMKLQPAALFAKGGLNELLSRIEAEARALVPNIKTAKGRKEIASNAARIPRSKTYLDELGKNLTADLKEQTKAVDVERKGMRDRLDALKVEVRAPLTAWEDAEEARKSAITARIDGIIDLACEWEYWEGADKEPYDARQLGEKLAELQSIVIDDSFGEFAAEATKEKERAFFTLEIQLAKRELYEKQQAELAKLREEAEAREQTDRDEKIRREAAAAAQQEAEERAEHKQRQRDQAAAAEQARIDSERRAAEQRAYEADQRAQFAATKERDRIEAEQREETAAAKKREADKAHRSVIEGDAIEGLMAFGLNREQAGTVVVAIRMGQIPNVSIQY